MKLLDWLQKPAESGIEGAVTDIVKIAILGLGGAIFNYLLAHVPGVSASFWASKRFAAYEVAIWLGVIAAASIWITHSVMQREISRIESESRKKEQEVQELISRKEQEAKELISRMESEAKKKEQEAKELTELDPGTGLLNFRALMEQLPKAMERSRQTKEPLTMVIFDIDRFKEVNTLLGHDRANVILKSVADALSPRAPDKAFRYPENVELTNERAVFRYGGDEFIILAFNTSISGAVDVVTGKRVFYGIRMTQVLQKNVVDIPLEDLAEKRKKLAEDRKEPRRSTKLTVSAGIADTNPSLDPTDTSKR